jgi:hypothetical protein
LTEVTSVIKPVYPMAASSSSTPETAGSGTAITTSSAPAAASRTAPVTCHRMPAGALAAAVRAVARVAGSAS